MIIIALQKFGFSEFLLIISRFHGLLEEARGVGNFQEIILTEELVTLPFPQCFFNI